MVKLGLIICAKKFEFYYKRFGGTFKNFQQGTYRAKSAFTDCSGIMIGMDRSVVGTSRRTITGLVLQPWGEVDNKNLQEWSAEKWAELRTLGREGDRTWR